MKRKLFLGFALIVLCIFVCRCSSLHNDVQQLLSLDDDECYYLSEVQQIEDRFYYINPQDDLLYVTNEEVENHELFLEEPIDSFVFTNTGLVCLTKQSTLIVYDSRFEKQTEIPLEYEKYMRGHIGLSTHKNMLIYDNSMIYVYDNDILKVEFDTGKKTTLVEDEAFLIYPYKNGVICLKQSVSFMDSYKFFFIDRNGDNKLQLFKEKYVYDLTIHDDWIYYIDKYESFCRFSIEERKKHRIIELVGMYVFDIVNNKVICRTDDNVISSELDGTEQQIMKAGNPNLIAFDSRFVLIGDTETREIMAHDINNNCQTVLEPLDVRGGLKFIDAEILGDIIFITIGNYEETQKAAFFYSTSGEQLYRME